MVSAVGEKKVSGVGVQVSGLQTRTGNNYLISYSVICLLTPDTRNLKSDWYPEIFFNLTSD
jgi:hypothetical protein